MAKQVLIDTNVFVCGFEFPDSNSAKIVELINNGELEAVITQQVLGEVVKYFKNFHGKGLADEFRHYLLEVCIIVQKSELEAEMDKNKGKIKGKDAEQIAAAQHLQLKLVSYDRDFEGFDEYLTPQDFVKQLGKESSSTKF